MKGLRFPSNDKMVKDPINIKGKEDELESVRSISRGSKKRKTKRTRKVS